MTIKDIVKIIKSVIVLFIIYTIGYVIIHFPLYFLLGIVGLIILYFITLIIRAAIATYHDMKKINKNKQNRKKEHS